jgi:hypothetical protein
MLYAAVGVGVNVSKISQKRNQNFLTTTIIVSFIVSEKQQK